MVEEKLLCNFLTITMYGIASIYILRKKSTFEQTPSFLLENLYFIKNACYRTIYA